MKLNSFFKDFLSEIRPGENHIEDYKRGHKTLRDRLCDDAVLKEIIVSTFLQGSFRRATAVRPHSGKRADVDVVVVTKLSREKYSNPQDAMDIFVPFLDKYYPDKYEFNARSIRIRLSYVDLDLVITSAPSESEIGILESASVTADITPEDFFELQTAGVRSLELNRAYKEAFSFWEKASAEPGWKTEPLYIPDREMKIWEQTHPIAQIEWTWAKNKSTNGHFVNVVKSLKWWRRVVHSDTKYPKGYPVEHIIGDYCPDDIDSVAEGVTITLENIVNRFRYEGMNNITPFLSDRGVPTHNVFGRLSGEDFGVFYAQVIEAAKIARRALDLENVSESAAEWQKLFGSKFPHAGSGSGNNLNDDGGGNSPSGGYSPRENRSTIGGGRFA